MPSATPIAAISEAFRRLITRRTYTVSQTRAFALGLLIVVSLLASTLVMHAWLFPGTPHHIRVQFHRQQHIYHEQLYNHHQRPLSRSRSRVPMQPSRFSFAQHPGEELGALVAFLGALASNSLPLSTNPHAFLDPDVVLDFDTRTGDEASLLREVQEAVVDAWARHPVVIFSEFATSAAPASREMKSIFEEMALRPAPTVFEVDKRVDTKVLRPLLQRLTRLAGSPVALVGGKPMLLNELRVERDTGGLKERVAKAGAVVNGAKRGKQ